MTQNISRNRSLLLVILLLDLIGFSLIFPLVPELLERFLKDSGSNPLDSWFFFLQNAVILALPAAKRTHPDLIVLLGGILGSIYSILQFFFSPFWGRLSDRIGRRPVLILTSIGLALSYFLWFATSSFTMFVAARVFGGIMAGNLGVASAAMADMSTPENRTREMGMLGAAFGLGFILGPALGGATSTWQIQKIFPALSFLNHYSGCALTAFLLSALSALFNLSFFSETLPERKSSSHAWVENPFRWTGKLAFPGFKTILIVYFLYIMFFSSFEFTLTFFYKLEFGMKPMAIAMIFVYIGVLIALGQGGIVRMLSGKIFEKTMAVIGLALLPLPLIALAYTAPYVSLTLLCLAPIALGSALVQPALSGLASLAAPAESQGLAMGVFRSSGSLARALGPIFGAYLYWFSGVKIAYWILGGLLIVTVLVSLRLADVRK